MVIILSDMFWVIGLLINFPVDPTSKLKGMKKRGAWRFQLSKDPCISADLDRDLLCSVDVSGVMKLSGSN